MTNSIKTSLMFPNTVLYCLSFPLARIINISQKGLKIEVKKCLCGKAKDSDASTGFRNLGVMQP